MSQLQIFSEASRAREVRAYNSLKGFNQLKLTAWRVNNWPLELKMVAIEKENIGVNIDSSNIFLTDIYYLNKIK